MGFFVLIVTALGIALPSAPASAGVFEYAAVLALSAFSITGAVAFSFAVLLHASIFLVTTGLGLMALSREGETVFHLAQTVQNLVSPSAREGVPPSTP
jgi:uncharacterized membrane protein YbhN (UPF0104 family)